MSFQQQQQQQKKKMSNSARTPCGKQFSKSWKVNQRQVNKTRVRSNQMTFSRNQLTIEKIILNKL